MSSRAPNLLLDGTVYRQEGPLVTKNGGDFLMQILIVFMNIRMCGKYQLRFVRSTMPFADQQNVFVICSK